MRALALAGLLLVPVLANPGEDPPPVAVELPAVTVDPRVEVMALVARLAGFREYNQEVGDSAYRRAADEHFRPFRRHAAVARLQDLRASEGISYDAVASFAVHLDWGEGRPTFLLPVEDGLPADARAPGRLGERWSAAAARAFLADLRAFVRDTGFVDFYAEQAPFRRAAEQRFRALLSERFDAGWFVAFYGGSPGAGLEGPRGKGDALVETHVHPGLLLGGHNYGVGVVLADGTELLTPCIGTWSFDDEGLPTYDADHLPVIVHEFCHAWANPLADAADLDAAGAVLFPPVRPMMEQQAYGTWAIVLRESLVGASVLRYERAHGTKARDLATLRKADTDRHFALVPRLEEALGRYEADRERWPTLAAFLPELMAEVEAAAEEQAERAAAAPKVLATIPADGDRSVDPAVTELTITFDRPMRTSSFSLTVSVDPFPTVAGDPAWRDDGRTFVLPVTLEPGKRYGFGVNGPGNTGFRAADTGEPVPPFMVSFTTR